MGVKVDDKNEVIVVTFAGELASDLVGATSKQVNNLISRKKIKNIVFHLDNCLSAEESVLHEMANIVQSVRRINGSGRLVGVNTEIYNTLKESSLDRILLERANLKTATTDMGFDFSDNQLNELSEVIEKRVDELKKEIKAKNPQQEEVKKVEPEKVKETPTTIDIQFVNHFLQSTVRTLESQFELPSKPGKPHQKQVDDPLFLGDVCGLISIDSEYFSGTMSISFPKKVFFGLVTNVFGEEVNEVNQENIDIVGEIANIVLGDAKRKLAEKGYKVQSALPHCIEFKDKEKHGDGLTISIPYQTEFGNFYTEVLEGRDIVQLKEKIGEAA